MEGRWPKRASGIETELSWGGETQEDTAATQEKMSKNGEEMFGNLRHVKCAINSS
jgi:hypothetical protein